MKLTGNVCLFSLLIGFCQAARFLAFLPFPARSHQRVFQPLLRHLASTGHHVTTLTPMPIEDPPANYTEILINDHLEELKESMGIKYDDKAFLQSGKTTMGQIMSVLMRKMGYAMTEKVFEEEAFQRLIRSDLTFDAIFLETTFLQECYIALGHRFNAPIIEIMPAGNFIWAYWIHGNPFDQSYIADFSLPYTDEMTFPQRIKNTVMGHWIRFIWWNFFLSDLQNLMDKHFRYPGWQNRPSMMEMVRNTSVVLINSDVALNYPYPMSTNFIEVGGINMFPPKVLPQDLQEYMDGAKDGVIYFTLGSHMKVSSTLGDLKDEFNKAFGKLKQKVLWKWETDFPDRPENVKISSWFPQQSILAHKNLKLFISHGGFLSLTESVYHGVPIIGIPLLGDQHKNVVHMEKYGYGLHLDYFNLTEPAITWAINEVLNNKSYKENALIRSALLKDKKKTPLETAVYWVEYVLRHNGAHHLKPAISKMPWYQQALLDVYLFMILAVLIPIYLIVKLIKYILCLIKNVSKLKRIDRKLMEEKKKK